MVREYVSGVTLIIRFVYLYLGLILRCPQKLESEEMSLSSYSFIRLTRE